MRYMLVFRKAKSAAAAEALLRDEAFGTFSKSKAGRRSALEFYEDDVVENAVDILQAHNITDFWQEVVEE